MPLFVFLVPAVCARVQLTPSARKLFALCLHGFGFLAFTVFFFMLARAPHDSEGGVTPGQSTEQTTSGVPASTVPETPHDELGDQVFDLRALVVGHA